MKQLTAPLFVLFLLMGNMVLGQQVPIISYPLSHEYTTTVVNPVGFTLGYYPDQYHAAYKPVCNSQNQLELLVQFPNPDQGELIQYYIEFYKKAFDPATGTPLHLGTNGTLVQTSAIIYQTSYNSTIGYASFVNVEPDHYYWARVSFKKQTIFGIWGAWNNAVTSQVNILSGGTAVASGYLNTVSTTPLPSIYGTTDVEEFDCETDIFLDASPSFCEDRYYISVEEFDLVNWQGIPSTDLNTGWIFGQAGGFNLSSFYTPGFELGKVYLVILAVGPEWDYQAFFITSKGAAIDGSIFSNSTETQLVHTKGGLAYYVHLDIVCDNAFSVRMKTSGTSCETKYKIDISRLSPAFNVIPGSEFSTNWINGQAPDIVSLSALYPSNFLLNNIYKVDYYVGDPEVKKTLYFKKVLCKSIKNNGGKGKRGIAEGSAPEQPTPTIDNLYPNPTTGSFNLSIGNLDEQQEVMVELFNLQGQKIYQSNLLTSSNLTIDISQQPAGIYMLRLIGNDGVLVSERVVKQ